MAARATTWYCKPCKRPVSKFDALCTRGHSRRTGPLQTVELPAPTWTTRDGTVLTIAAMTDDHLLNAISYCERRLMAETGTGTVAGPKLDLGQVTAVKLALLDVEVAVFREALPDLIAEGRRRGLVS